MDQQIVKQISGTIFGATLGGFCFYATHFFFYLGLNLLTQNTRLWKWELEGRKVFVVIGIAAGGIFGYKKL